MAAFDLIYHTYCRRLHAFALKFLKHDQDAEEIVQEVFIKIWEYREKINAYTSFESYLFTISYNTTMSLLRKRLSESKSREYLKLTQPIYAAEHVVDELYYKQLNDRVTSLLEELTPRQREIFLLSREEGLSHKDIGQRLNISEKTVNNHMVSILKFLRKNMGASMAVILLFVYLFLS